MVVQRNGKGGLGAAWILVSMRFVCAGVSTTS